MPPDSVVVLEGRENFGELEKLGAPGRLVKLEELGALGRRVKLGASRAPGVFEVIALVQARAPSIASFEWQVVLQ